MWPYPMLISLKLRFQVPLAEPVLGKSCNSQIARTEPVASEKSGWTGPWKRPNPLSDGSRPFVLFVAFCAPSDSISPSCIEVHRWSKVFPFTGGAFTGEQVQRATDETRIF